MKCIKQIVPGMMMASIALADNRNNKIDQAIVRNLVTSINNNNQHGRWAYNRRMVVDEVSENDEAEEAKLDLTENAIESSVSEQPVSSESGSYSFSDSVSGEDIASGEESSFLRQLKDKVIRELDPAIDEALRNALTKKNLDEYFVGTMQQEAVLAEAMKDDEPAAIAENDADQAKTADNAENDQVGAADIPTADDEPSIAIEDADQANVEAKVDEASVAEERRRMPKRSNRRMRRVSRERKLFRKNQ